MTLSTAEKNAMLDGRAASYDAMGLHTGDPGAAGTDNEVSGGGYTRQDPAFDPAAAGELVLSAALTFSGPASSAVTWASLWAGGTFAGRAQLTGDTAFDSAGEFELTTGTKVVLSDPAP